MRKIVLSSQALIFTDGSQVQGPSFKLIWLFRKELGLIADFLPLPVHLWAEPPGTPPASGPGLRTPPHEVFLPRPLKAWVLLGPLYNLVSTGRGIIIANHCAAPGGHRWWQRLCFGVKHVLKICVLQF